MQIGLDATYSLGKNLSGVGVYSRELMFGLAEAYPADRFRFYYRSHRLLKSFAETLPANASRRLLRGSRHSPRCDIFHSLNQRIDFLKRPERRTVATFHDLFVMTGEYSSSEFRERFTEQARSAAERSDAIIAISRFTASQIEQLLGVEPERIHVIPHGVHLPQLSGAKPREKIVLFVGIVQRRKNLGRLVKAFEKMPTGWRLVIAGAPEGFGAAEELRSVEESSRKADMDLVGHVTRAELDALYARANIFAFPSLDEGFGMPVLEAMAHGLPVLTSTTSALPEVAGDAAVLVDPRNIDEMAAALNRLAGDEALRDELRERGLARAREFPWSRTLEKTWAVYEGLLQK